MPTSPSTITALLRDALNHDERLRLSHYLHPDVRWHNPHGRGAEYLGRTQVLARCAHLHARGGCIAVEETFTYPQAVVLGLVADPEADAVPGARTLLYQVFHIADGLITDIRGYGDRCTALEAACTGSATAPCLTTDSGQ
jgi:hypothetical protein